MPKTRWIIGLLVLFYLIRLLLIACLELAPDESYYWYWAKHLDWSYYDHPPMIAYIMALFIGLIGDNEFSG
jgi:dolichol-phosphate mannosyltransferase